MSTQITFGNVGGDVSGNIAGGNITLQDAVKAHPEDQQIELAGMADAVAREIDRPEPDAVTVKVALQALFNASVPVAKIVWATWQNPLKGLGLAWEMFTQDKDDTE